MERPRIVVIAGPTATGKTALGVSLALELGGEIVNSDSVQIYRELDIGSGKPTNSERRGVPHHLIDALDLSEPIDAVQYARRAEAVIAEIAARGRVPIVVGGTGLWLRALVRGLVEVPPVDPAVRARLEGEADAIGAPALHARLAQIDPLAAERIHSNDRLRIVRALEVWEQTGRPMGELQKAHALGAPRYGGIFMVVDLPPDLLAEQIRNRAASMLEAGWVDEVRGVVARHGADVRALRSVGYRQLLDHVVRGAPLEEVIPKVIKATRIYARRQRTWFRSEPGIDWRTTADEALRPDGIERVRAALRPGG